MSTLFISHSPLDSGFVRELRAALELHGPQGWIVSRELRGGDPLWPEIQKAIEDASAYAVVVSLASLQSKWIGKELRHAIELQKQRGRHEYPVLPLSLNGTRLGVLEEFFDEEPLYISVNDAVGEIEAALNDILTALGKRLPADIPPTPRPRAEPLEELVLELTDLTFHEQYGVRRASARACLIYQPATPSQREVSGVGWRFVTPLGPIEAEELRWYLEKYAIWPSAYFQDRARRVERSLVEWGRLLYAAALPIAHTANVMQAWERIDDNAERRFSVHVDATLEAGASAAEAAVAREAATALLGLPWELLHDGGGFLFQGPRPTRVRRRLPNTRVLDIPMVATPIRILLVTARPEDEDCGYFDHRVSALPLVEAMEALGGLVRIHVLSPPTLPALREALEGARHNRKPYHVVHFDGHGVYDRQIGLGGLCFEHPEDAGKLEERRHVTVLTDELGSLLRDHRIPLVFLEACQTALAERASESVASELLAVGVASVVAMSHAVLVETARRFVGAFYGALARGSRVGDAMLEGQRTLKDDNSRGRIFGAGELRLEDWFVPVLFQEKDDPQLFRSTPTRQSQEDMKTGLAARLGELPREPATGFVGRSRDLLALQRLLHHERYAVVRGQGGEGKTALAAELARWMVRSQQIHRAAFVSVETHSHAAAVLDAVGRQIVPSYSVAIFGDLEKAIVPVERALTEQSTLIVVDNMESVLLPPYGETSETLSAEWRRELAAILALCARLNATGNTRLVFTSREALPTPFDDSRNRRELQQLAREDAVKLVERVLNCDPDDGAVSDVARESIEQLVESVHGHARTLALLGPALHRGGVDATRASISELMAEMERMFPGNREQSLFASLELSLRRMSSANRDRVRVVGAFRGVIDLDVLRVMMAWEPADVASLAAELVDTGLATPDPYNHLTLNPALCPYLRGQMKDSELEALSARWCEAMRVYVKFLVREQDRNPEIAATLAVLELPNLFVLLEQVQGMEDAEATIDLTTCLFALLKGIGRPRLLERVAQVRDSAAAALEATWSHARFEAQRTRIEQQLASGGVREALEGAQQLLRNARTGGEAAYRGAGYDLAGACWLLAHVLRSAAGAESALPLLDEAYRRFELIAEQDGSNAAEGMVSICLAERGDCLLFLGRLDEAAAAYLESIRRAEKLGNDRQIAVGKAQLGSVLLYQRRHAEALEVYAEARERFTRLDEPRSVAVIWQQIGRVHQEAGQPEAAEDAYRKSLAIEVRLGDVAAQASTLGQLGILYGDALGRPEEAAAFFRQAADRFGEINDSAGEARTRNNLASCLLMLRRVEEARWEIHRAIECKAPFGHAVEPWTSWAICAEIEEEARNPAAAAEARRKATECYLAYRRDGGENHHADGRICFAVIQLLRSEDPTTAASFLRKLAAEPETPGTLHPFIQALQRIVSGSRDRSLVDDPKLDYTMSAELLYLLDVLEEAER